MATDPHARPLEYHEILRALGSFIQQQHMSDVTITEFDRGWIVAGLTYKTTAQGFLRVPIDFVVSHDEIAKLNQEMREQRRADHPKRGWLR
jgi:hypothetical protein